MNILHALSIASAFLAGAFFEASDRDAWPMYVVASGLVGLAWWCA